MKNLVVKYTSCRVKTAFINISPIVLKKVYKNKNFFSKTT